MKRILSPSARGLAPADKRMNAEDGFEGEVEDVRDARDARNAPIRVVDAGSVVDRMQDMNLAAASQDSRNPTKRPDLDREFTFNSATQEGPWRDKITVDIFKIGDVDYKGTVKLSEARCAIYKKALGLKRENLHAVEIEFRGHPVITYRLKERLNIDEEFHRDTFSYTREGVEGPVVIEGRIRGVRSMDGYGTFISGDQTRLKIKNCKWSIDEEVINEWLDYYGEVTTPVKEETHREAGANVDTGAGAGTEDEEDEQDEKSCAPLGTGNLWVTMKLSWKIPQFLPMMGRKVEIYYRGIEQTCVNCYQEGHMRKDCTNEKVHWLDYVSHFIETNELRPEIYGRWFQLTEVMRTQYQQEAQQAQQAEERTETIGSGQESPRVLETGVGVVKVTEKQTKTAGSGQEKSPKVDDTGVGAEKGTESVATGREAQAGLAQEVDRTSEKQKKQTEDQSERQLRSREQEDLLASYRTSVNYRKNTGEPEKRNQAPKETTRMFGTRGAARGTQGTRGQLGGLRGRGGWSNERAVGSDRAEMAKTGID